MEENSELEEGEACYYRDDDGNDDPDTALSYIDEKIQHVLGHFQKDFEGGVSAQNLGAKFGGYGSFLPTYECSPSIRSRPKSPQRNSSTLRSPNNLPKEDAVQNLKAPSNAPSFVRPGAASCSAHSLHNPGVPSDNASVKQDTRLFPAQASQKITLKDESLTKSSNPTDQRTLKVRIKVGSGNLAKKNAAIYSGLGLGLDNSPSSSMGDSPEGSGGILPVSQEITSESPTRILQDMISFPIPGGMLISPLHDNLCSLMRKEKERLSRYDKPVPSSKDCKGHSSVSGNESVSVLGNGKLLIERKAKLVGKSERLVGLKHGNGMDFENELTLLARKKSENETPGGKEILSDGLKRASLSNSTYMGTSVKATGATCQVSVETNKYGVGERLFSSDLVKDLPESISGQESGKIKKQNAQSSSVEKIWEQRVVDTRKDALVDLRDKGKCGGNKTACPLRCKGDLNHGSTVPQKLKVGLKAIFHVHDDPVTLGKGKPSVEGKKSKGIKSGGKPAAVSMKDSLAFHVGEAPKHTSSSYDVSTSKNKMHKMKSKKDTNNVRDNRRDSLNKNLEQTGNRFGSAFGDKPKVSSIDDFSKKQSASLNKLQKRLSGKKVDNQLMSGAPIKDASYAGPHNTESELASEVAPPVIDPVLIEENWVACDSCQQWRLLPFGMKPEQLPEKWLCSMLDWLPGMNRCDISEEETTKAVNALLYQIPVVESQNNVNGTAFGVTSAHVEHLDQNHHGLNSHAISNQGKKKYDLKGIPKAGFTSGLIQVSNSTKNHLQESLKSKILSDTKRPLVESNLIKNSSFHHLDKSCDLVGKKPVRILKEKHMNGGVVKQKKMKNKREADKYGFETSKKIKSEDGYETSKKSKIEDRYSTDKHPNSTKDLARVGLSSSTGLPTKASGKNTQKDNEGLFSVDAKCDTKSRLVVSVKKLGNQAQASCDGGSLDMRTCDKRDGSVKKRKLKEWQDNQDGSDGKVYAMEESSESGYGKEKKSRASKTEGKVSSINNGDERSNRKGMVTQINLSSCREHPVDDFEELRNLDKDLPSCKHRIKIASKQNLDGVDTLRRDFACGHVSGAATSSSSKVSGSHKTRANLEEVKGSSVESVSSSPMRTSYPEKRASAGGDILGKDDVVNGGVSVINYLRRFWDGEGDSETNQPGTRRDTNQKICGKAKSSSEFMKSNLGNGDASTMENLCYSGDRHTGVHCYNENRGKNCYENVFFPQKSGKCSSSQSKNNDRSSASDMDRDKVKVSGGTSAQEDLHSKKSQRYESESGPNHPMTLHETRSNVKHSFPDKPIIKCSKGDTNYCGRSESGAQRSIGYRMENQSKPKERDDLDAKLGSLCRTIRKTAHQQNLNQNFGGENQADPIQTESVSWASKSFPHMEDEGKQEIGANQAVPVHHPEARLDGLPVSASGNGDVPKVLKQPGNDGTTSGVGYGMGHHAPDLNGVRELNAPSPWKLSTSSQTASNVLKKAKDLRNCAAELLKSSEFDFEINEAYFQAALKFLHGASLLETCSSESGRHGEMNQMQAYSTAAKLCEICAHYHENCQEMAAAALAYKCMEVAYMRLVYCNHSSSSRDLNDLQVTLQMFPQGESPSSSASDVDNLYNQATVDKAALPKGTFHAAGSHVIVAPNQPKFVQLLDFTQDVNFAMEASRKSQNAFAAANMALGKAQNSECIIRVRKVIDFSFQDIEELLHLVQLAREAISPAGIGGARD